MILVLDVFDQHYRQQCRWITDYFPLRNLLGMTRANPETAEHLDSWQLNATSVLCCRYPNEVLFLTVVLKELRWNRTATSISFILISYFLTKFWVPVIEWGLILSSRMSGLLHSSMVERNWCRTLKIGVIRSTPHYFCQLIFSMFYPDQSWSNARTLVMTIRRVY